MRMIGGSSRIYNEPQETIERYWLGNTWYVIFREELMPDGLFVVELRGVRLLTLLYFMNEHIN